MTSGSQQIQAAPQPRVVMVVEDEHLLAQHIKNNLADLGYEVLGPAANGRQAIEIAEQQRPDIAILDLRMPHMNGVEAAKVLYGQMGVPIVVVSAHSDEELLANAIERGVYGYLLKPVGRENLRIGLSIAWQRYLDQQKAG